MTVAVVVACACASVPASAKRPTKAQLMESIAALTAKVDSLQGAMSAMDGRYVPVRKTVDPSWEKWADVRYNYGFNVAEQPVHNTVDGVLESTVMLSVRGGRGRWNSESATPYSKFVDGGHLFEGWNASETCRLTMLIGKQTPDIACIQVYSPKGLYRDERHFGWVKLGSDTERKGVDFGSHWAISFVPLTLGCFDKAPADTKYPNGQLGSTAVPVGTLYYDTAVGKIGCYTGKGWQYLKFE